MLGPPEGVYVRSQGRISIKHLSTLQVCPLKVSIDCLVPEVRSLVLAAGPDVSHSLTPSHCAATLGLELKHSGSLHFISKGSS